MGGPSLRLAMRLGVLPVNVTSVYFIAALAVPCGRAEDGLPASVQLVGRPGADALVLAAGERLADALSGL